ncbi:MAG: thymidine phosphorylase family protein [Flavobacteriales bacterium]|nr:thymidine phosphorylase family protein [Flavobacteriales bacterium]
MEHVHGNTLTLRSIGIDTYRENIIYMRGDCPVCRSEGFTALTRLVVANGAKSIIATLNVVHSDLLRHSEAALSTEAMKRLGGVEGGSITISHLDPISSLSLVRAKIYGRELSDEDLRAIITDVTAGRYSNVELAAFIVGSAGDHLNERETIGLTRAMIASGQRLSWGPGPIMDKHCVGGLPGNRTTPIVVSIVAAAGLTIPKTSSRAITSPAGTADVMETMTPVDLGLDRMRRVVETEGGCMVWGGAVQLSPADDILISVEKALDIDSEGQMIASVLSKKVAAGSTHAIFDIPLGPTAKVRSRAAALALKERMTRTAAAVGLNAEVLITDGGQPVGRGIGPALEAMDVLAVLRHGAGAPQDLRERALVLAGSLLDLSGKFPPSTGAMKAREILESGQAWRKFHAICEAQGGFNEPKAAQHQHDVLAEHDGIVRSVDNRRLARIAKLAGAPRSAAAGISFHAPVGRMVRKGDLLFTVHAEGLGELEYALAYMRQENGTIQYD